MYNLLSSSGSTGKKNEARKRMKNAESIVSLKIMVKEKKLWLGKTSLTIKLCMGKEYSNRRMNGGHGDTGLLDFLRNSREAGWIENSGVRRQE